MRKPRLKRIKLSTATNAYDLLNDVCTAVLDEPRRIDMGTWFQKVLTKTFKPNSGRRAEGRRTYVSAPACGTVGCIAGWIQTLRVPDFNPGEEVLSAVFTKARHALCGAYDYQLYAHARALFYGKPLALPNAEGHDKNLYPFPDHRVGTKAYARDVVANIRAFQARFETQLRERKVA